MYCFFAALLLLLFCFSETKNNHKKNPVGCPEMMVNVTTGKAKPVVNNRTNLNSFYKDFAVRSSATVIIRRAPFLRC